MGGFAGGSMGLIPMLMGRNKSKGSSAAPKPVAESVTPQKQTLTPGSGSPVPQQEQINPVKKPLPGATTRSGLFGQQASPFGGSSTVVTG